MCPGFGTVMTPSQAVSALQSVAFPACDFTVFPVHILQLSPSLKYPALHTKKNGKDEIVVNCTRFHKTVFLAYDALPVR